MPHRNNSWAKLTLTRAIDCLQAGGVIAYPCEAVFGLGCDPFNPEAVARLLEIKGRSVDKGLILVASEWAHINPLLATLDTAMKAKCQQIWPGYHTLVLPDPGQRIPKWIKGKHPSVALRLSTNRYIGALCRGLGGPLVSTSANRQSRPPMTQSLQVRRQLGHQLDFILPGPTDGFAQPSPIQDLVSGQQLR